MWPFLSRATAAPHTTSKNQPNGSAIPMETWLSLHTSCLLPRLLQVVFFLQTPSVVQHSFVSCVACAVAQAPQPVPSQHAPRVQPHSQREGGPPQGDGDIRTSNTLPPWLYVPFAWFCLASHVRYIKMVRAFFVIGSGLKKVALYFCSGGRPIERSCFVGVLVVCIHMRWRAFSAHEMAEAALAFFYRLRR